MIIKKDQIMDKLTTYKAQFCRQYFYQLKQFIREFDLSDKNKDPFGMRFLLDAYDSSGLKDAQKYKDNCKWRNDIEGSDKELMLAIEEYFFISDSSSSLQKQQEKLFDGLADPDHKATDDVIKAVFTDEVTMSAILTHFGISISDDDKTLEPQIQKFDHFIDKINKPGTKCYSLADYNKALHLFQQCRNDGTHNLLQQEVPQRKIALQFLAFVYIGLTYILRMAWEKKGDLLVGYHYNRPQPFEMPTTTLKIVVKVKDSSNDKIFKYVFVPNIKNGSVREEKEIEPTEIMELTYQVRKYERFKLEVTYGTSSMQDTKWFGNNEPRLLSYYYWNPIFEVTLPSISYINPGLKIGNIETEELIVKLLDDVNRRQEGLAKEKTTETVNKVLSSVNDNAKVYQQIIQ